MAGPRRSKPVSPGSRPLLNLGGGDKSGLEKAFQALVGKIRPKAAAPASAPPPTAPAKPNEVFNVLQSIGFEQTGEALTHPLAPDRLVKCQPPAAAADPEGWALDWAARNFPETEFYLPYISRRANRARLATGRPAGRPTTPEPEYDDDGFLAEYP